MQRVAHPARAGQAAKAADHGPYFSAVIPDSGDTWQKSCIGTDGAGFQPHRAGTAASHSLGNRHLWRLLPAGPRRQGVAGEARLVASSASVFGSTVARLPMASSNTAQAVGTSLEFCAFVYGLSDLDFAAR